MSTFEVGDLVTVTATGRVHAIALVLDDYTFDERPKQQWVELLNHNGGYVQASGLSRATIEQSRDWVKRVLKAQCTASGDCTHHFDNL